MIVNIPAFVMQVGIVFLLGRHIPNMLDLIVQKGKFNKKFKQIYDNFDETILIVDRRNYSLEYIND